MCVCVGARGNVWWHGNKTNTYGYQTHGTFRACQTFWEHSCRWVEGVRRLFFRWHITPESSHPSFLEMDSKALLRRPTTQRLSRAELNPIGQAMEALEADLRAHSDTTRTIDTIATQLGQVAHAVANIIETMDNNNNDDVMAAPDTLDKGLKETIQTNAIATAAVTVLLLGAGLAFVFARRR